MAQLMGELADCSAAEKHAVTLLRGLECFQFGERYELIGKDGYHHPFATLDECLDSLERLFAGQSFLFPLAKLEGPWSAGRAQQFRNPSEQHLGVHAWLNEGGNAGAGTNLVRADTRVLKVVAMEFRAYSPTLLSAHYYAKEAKAMRTEVLRLVTLYNLSGSWDTIAKVNL